MRVDGRKRRELKSRTEETDEWGEKKKKKKWEVRGNRKVRGGGGGSGRRREKGEDKNDLTDSLHPGSRIDVHLSLVSVVSPTNHDVTSTGQYNTLRASSSHTCWHPSVCMHSTTGTPLLLELINLAANHRHAYNT